MIWGPKDSLDRRYNPLRLFVGRRPAGMPPAYWQRLKRIRVLVGLAVAILWSGGAVGVLLIVDRIVYLPVDVNVSLCGMIAACLLGAGLLETIPWIVKRRFCKWLRKHEYRVCTECGYLLGGLPEEHRCPECGVEYKMEDINQQWQQWVPRVHV